MKRKDKSGKNKTKVEDLEVKGVENEDKESNQHTEKGSKMNPKKKKRLENYIKKKLAKEEKQELLDKLSKSAFTSDLMLSSRTLGQAKMTTREKLRHAINQQKAGIPITDKSVRLVIEKEIDDEGAFDEIDNYAKSTMELAKSLAKPNQGKIQLAIGSALKSGTELKPIPKKVKNKKKSMVSVRELLKRNNPEISSEDDDFDSSDSSSNSEDDNEDNQKNKNEDQKEEEVKMKNIEDNPTTSIAYLQSDSVKTETIRNTVKPLIKPITNPTIGKADKKFYINVDRSEEIQAARLNLPICGEEQIIMEAITNNDAIIVCGETGSGKTTQLPQFLYEAGYGHPDSPNPGIVGITQPRRVAAVSMANRVAKELNTNMDTVSYQIRYDATTSKNTRIKFMTDGVLLREISKDFLLNKYSAILLDEAHERTLNTDILIGVLSRALKLRNKLFKEGKEGVKPLKLIIMSATLRVEDFRNNTNLFSTDNIPQVIKVDARQYPVTTHFNKRTPEYDYLGETFKKVVKIHTRLPHGGILVFLTGQNEITSLCRKLQQKFPAINNKRDNNIINNNKLKADVAIEAEDLDLDEDIEINSFDKDENEQEEFGDSEEELDEDGEVLELSEEASYDPLYVLPLYAMLPTHQQLKVFEAVPEGHRLCVIATNVAETSLTIPNIRYVVDSGKAKEKYYDNKSNISSFKIDWISKASADQRAGRAGRTGPGHCYRLYSSAVFNDQFEQFSEPEIFRNPIEGVVLQMKSMNLDNVTNFPFPTPPSKSSIQKAERLLNYLGSIDDENKKISPLGTLMSMFPVSPRFSKMLAIGQQHDCMPYVIALVAALSVGDPFLKEHQAMEEIDDEQEQNLFTGKKKRFYQVLAKFGGKEPTSDLLRILNVVGAYEYGGADEKFCRDNFLRVKAMDEIRKMRRQLTNLVQLFCPNIDVVMDPKLAPPTPSQTLALKQIILAGFVDQVAILKTLVDKNQDNTSSNKNQGIKGTPAYKIMWGNEDVYIHPTSAIYLMNPPPQYLTYNQLSKTSSGTVLMQGVTIIDPKWLINIAKPLVTFSKPLNEKDSVSKIQNAMTSIKQHGKSDQLVKVNCSFGPKSWPLPNHTLNRDNLKK